MKVYINGKLVPRQQAKVSVFDHGLLYGDGVFEGIRSYDCLVFKLKEHIERLYSSARAIMLDIPLSKDEVVKAVIKTLKANNLRDAYIRLVVTRGEGDLGLDPRKCKDRTVFIITDKITLYPEEYYKKGLSLITVPTRRNINEGVDPQIKSLNYLNNILAKIEAINSGKEEAIMLNHEGKVVECTGDNIFLVKHGKLITPPSYAGALKGITASAATTLAKRLIIRVEEIPLTRYDIFCADEMFLTGTAAEIIPVVEVDGRMIGNGKPGDITLKLMKEFRRLTKVDGVKYSLKK